MPVAVIAEIIDVVIVAAVVADLRRPHQEPVLVVVELVAFAVVVAQVGDLRGKARDRKVLAVQIGDEHVVAPDRLADIVEAAIGVLFQALEKGEVVLPAIGVAVAEEAHAELVVLKQEAAEIGVERLDADPDRVEIVILRHVADVIVDKPFLDAEK